MDFSDYRRNTRHEMLAFVPEQCRRILEIGCGEGIFVSSITGCKERWGVEPDTISAQVASSQIERVLVGTFDSVRNQLPANYFDLVICNDVIEHMIDHDAFFREIQAYMVPGAVIIGSVPNVRYFKNLFDLVVLRDWDYKLAGVLDRTHLRFFTLRSLRRSLAASGLQVEQVQGINSMLRSSINFRSLHYLIFGVALIAGSLGTATDTKYMQLGFRASFNRA
jgi:2-polyprenyl-3-methyl-5-hydroxy-6-metoxy-1,4-benzoquinol methylase